jgi:hypothetical protein
VDIRGVFRYEVFGFFKGTERPRLVRPTEDLKFKVFTDHIYFSI